MFSGIGWWAWIEMSALWQTVIAACIVGGAAIYLVRRLWRLGGSKKSTGCPACSECVGWWQKADLASTDPPDAQEECPR